MGKSTISMAIFNSYVKLPEAIFTRFQREFPDWSTKDRWNHQPLVMSFKVGIIRNSINATLSRRKRVMDFSNSPSRDLFMWSLWLESSFETKKRSGLPQPAKVCEITSMYLKNMGGCHTWPFNHRGSIKLPTESNSSLICGAWIPCPESKVNHGKPSGMAVQRTRSGPVAGGEVADVLTGTYEPR